jgi:adenylate cyclase
MAALRGGPVAACVLPLEVERKFLVPTPPDWLSSCRVHEIEQGYLAIEGDEIEVRLRRRGDDTYLTVKRGSGEQRTEVEVEVDAEQFAALWPLTDYQPQSFEPPEWVGDELTGNPAYANQSLATKGVPPDAPAQRAPRRDS